MTNPFEAVEHLVSNIPKYLSQLKAIDKRTAHFNDIISASDVRRKRPSCAPIKANYAGIDTLAPRPTSIASDSSAIPSSVDRIESSPYKRKRDESEGEEDIKAPLRLKYRARSKVQVDFDGDAQGILENLVERIAQARALVWRARSQLPGGLKSSPLPLVEGGEDSDGLRSSLEQIDRHLEENSRLCEVASFQMLRLGQFHEESQKLQENFQSIFDRCGEHLRRRKEQSSPSTQRMPADNAHATPPQPVFDAAESSPQQTVPPRPGEDHQRLNNQSKPPSLTHSLPSSSNPTQGCNSGQEDVSPGPMTLQGILAEQHSNSPQAHNLSIKTTSPNHNLAEDEDGDEDEDEDFDLNLPPIRLTSKLRT